MRILILGGGVGGQVAANELRRRLSPEHRVTLIERDTRHAFAPSFLWVMTGDRQPQHVTRNVRELVRPGVEVITAEIRRIDVANRRVETGHESLAYDYLVVALVCTPLFSRQSFFNGVGPKFVLGLLRQ